jgi:cobalt-zinc-cadmium efflux system protein
MTADPANRQAAVAPDASRSAEARSGLRERVLGAAILLTLSFAAVEAVGGWWANSLALMADAGHMLTDSFALALAWAASRLGRRPPNARMSYGYRRAEVLAAFANALLMLGILSALTLAAIERLQAPREVLGGHVMVIALIGLMINLAVLALLRSDRHGTLNMRGAVLHVVGDLLGSVAALTAGLVIWTTGWNLIDPLLSLFIAALILVSAIRLIRDAIHVLMEAVPPGIDLGRVEQHMRAQPGIVDVHDLHIWTLAGDRILLSAHLVVASHDAWPRQLAAMQQLLRDEFGISHATLQPEPPGYLALADQLAGALPLDDHAH